MSSTSSAVRRPAFVFAALVLSTLVVAAAGSDQKPADRAAAARAAAEARAAEKWVADTLKKMTLEENVGQLLAPSINAAVTPVDSDAYEDALHLLCI